MKENEVFSQIMESLYTYDRIVQNYQNTSRYYGIEEPLFSTEAHAIQMIGDYPGLSLNELAEKTYRTNSGMSLLIKSLSQKSLVKRLRDEDDNRRYIINLTQKGEKVYKYHQELDSKNHEIILNNINKMVNIDINELNTTAKILENINIVLNEIHNK